MASDLTQPTFYKPGQTALLLLDFHSYILQHYASDAMDHALQQAVKLKHWAQAHDIEVIHCLIDVDVPPLETTKGIERLSTSINSIKQTGGIVEHELIREQQPGSEKTFTRRLGVVSALNSPGIVDYLRQKGLVSLILAGFSTSGCVLRTAFAATDLGFVVTVAADACADNKEGVHEFLVDRLLDSRGYVDKVSEIESSLEKVWR